ncbi:MAG: DUF3604 domain-containing protein, partial [Armatimonadota bacterium]
YGRAAIEPSGPVVAGTVGTWVLTYTVGEYGFDDGGHLKVAWRFATDWAPPRFDCPHLPDCATVATTGRASVVARFRPYGHVRPWQKCVIVDVFDDGLAPGDRIILTYGDTRGGSPGSRAQTFCEDTFEFRVVADPFGTGQGVVLPDSPTVRIVPGPPSRLVVIAPSEAVVGQPVEVFVKAEDRWGNPVPDYQARLGPLEFDGPTGAPLGDWRRLEEGGYCVATTFDAPGGAVVRVRDDVGMHAEGNPCVVVPKVEQHQPFWGDLHGQSEETVGTNTVEDYFRFARDQARLDFCSHQGNDFQVTREFWARLQKAVRDFHQPGKFVTFLGYEWSGTTSVGGDHNVLYLRDDEPIFRSSHELISDRSDQDTDRCPVSALYEELRGRDAITIPHVGGRRANLAFHDDRVEPLVEIYSGWGVFEWLLEEALQRGYKVGVVAGSDDHKGRPGASHTGARTFAVYGGLTCVYARDLSREAVWEALRARRCYATTGRRISLKVFADGHWMGEEYDASRPPQLRVEAHGTTGIEHIEVHRGTHIIQTHDPVAHAPLSARLIRVRWGGARIKGRNRDTDWSGHLDIEGGNIISAREWSFDNPLQGITLRDRQSVAWESTTAGDDDGLILEIEAADDATLAFATQPLSFVIRLDDVTDEPAVFDAEGIDQYVLVERLREEARPRSVTFTFRDDDVQPGCNAYWVRLQQEDGALVWSSPIFVNFK